VFLQRHQRADSNDVIYCHNRRGTPPSSQQFLGKLKSILKVGINTKQQRRRDVDTTLSKCSLVGIKADGGDSLRCAKLCNRRMASLEPVHHGFAHAGGRVRCNRVEEHWIALEALTQGYDRKSLFPQ